MFQDWGACLDNGVATLKCLPIVFMNVITALIMFVGTTALFFFIMAGIKFTRSGGDPKQVSEAQKTVTYAIIGLVIVLLSFFIINVISTATGNDCIKSFNFNCQ